MDDKPGVFHLTPDDVGELYRITEELRGTTSEAKTLLETDDTAKELALVYERLGENVSPQILDQAVCQYAHQKFSFEQPKPGFGLHLASAYLHRKIIGKWVLGGAAATSLLVGAIGLGTHLYHRHEESTVEAAVEAAFHQRDDSIGRLRALEASPLVKKLPPNERDQLETLIRTAKERLPSSDPFFSDYCHTGKSVDDVTKDNYPKVRTILTDSIAPLLQDVDVTIKRGENILFVEKDLRDVSQGLESLMGTIRLTNPPSSLLQRAVHVYEAGTDAITRRQPDAARQQVKQLDGVREDCLYLSTTSASLDPLYRGVREIAREDKAIGLIEKSYREASHARADANIPSLRQAVRELENLSAVLNEEYTVRIVNRPKVKSGIDRYYTDEQGRRSSGFYLIVEAVDQNGQVTPLDITNQENGATERVTMWGERVLQEVYEKVKSDKKDNGIVDDNVVGGKKRGFLTPSYEPHFKVQNGRITHW